MDFLLISVSVFCKDLKKKILKILSTSSANFLNVKASSKKVKQFFALKLRCPAYLTPLLSSYFFYFSSCSHKSAAYKKGYQLFTKNPSLWSFFGNTSSLLGLGGVLSIISFFKYALVALFFVNMLVISLVFFKKAAVFKMLSAWLCVFYFAYLLISGFVFFIKKYQFSKFTGAIQRFWKRTFIIFWSLEVFLFIIFIYLLFNSNYEPFYIYDNAQTQKTRLTSLKSVMIGSVYVVSFVWIFYSILFYLKVSLFYRILPLLLFTIAAFMYYAWQEFYPFFYVISFYNNYTWSYDIDEHLWFIDQELKRTRIPNHYFNVFVILKFWHIVFIVSFWVFVLNSAFALGRLRYPLFGAATQNVVIFFMMYWLSLYAVIKFSLGKFMSYSYYWFFINLNSFFSHFFIFELLSYADVSLYSLLSCNSSFSADSFLQISRLTSLSFSGLGRKDFVRSDIVSNLVSL